MANNTTSMNGNNGSTSSITSFAAAGIAQLDQIAASVPGYEPADGKIWRKIGRKAAYPNEYVESAADVVEESEKVRAATGFDAPAARDGVKLSNEIRALIKKGKSFLDGLRFTDAKLRSSLVEGCDKVYAVVPGLSRVEKSLKPHRDAMQHASRRHGGRKKEAPAPAPVTGK